MNTAPGPGGGWPRCPASAATSTIATVAEFIYTMKQVRKAHGDKVILDGVTIAFYPGAKIGVVGPNGAGKSSVLRIMAGLDQPNNGEAFLTPGATVGILQQEPTLDEDKSVLGNVQEGLGEVKTKLDRFNEIAEKMATDYSDELMEEMGRLQEDLDHADAWDLDSQLEQAMDALRCPPPDEPVIHLSGGERRRVAPLFVSKRGGGSSGFGRSWPTTCRRARKRGRAGKAGSRGRGRPTPPG